ncbi:MAG: 16S rRNA (cytidine(1402)-2'-O)-methyltransferase [Acidimicrobiia bacterium]|nr:16S rRNA (cytidine(1402)-2'-O)-methyltransferase [Acidimicrobiia bacterium]
MTQGTLVLCGGPIGNLGDAAPRLAEALAGADVVYAEDTRRARTLFDRLGVTTPLRSYFVGNEDRRAEEIGRRLSGGETVAVLTDAGMPAIADPGLSAVRAAVKAEATVTVVPGPSAVTAALAVAGMPADRFVFEGFLPRTGSDRSARLAAIGAETRTVVLFCAPKRLVGDLEDLTRACGDRDVVVCRELTKRFEETWRGRLVTASQAWAERDVRGEVTVVLAGGAEPEPSLDAALAEVRTRVAGGEPLSAAVRAVAEASGVRRNALYEAALAEI